MIAGITENGTVWGPPSSNYFLGMANNMCISLERAKGVEDLSVGVFFLLLAFYALCLSSMIKLRGKKK